MTMTSHASQRVAPGRPPIRSVEDLVAAIGDLLDAADIPVVAGSVDRGGLTAMFCDDHVRIEVRRGRRLRLAADDRPPSDQFPVFTGSRQVLSCYSPSLDDYGDAEPADLGDDD
jgi:hypothetical protein